MPSENERKGEPVSVLGAGSWGTALAIRLADNGHRVTLWGRDEALLEKIAQTRCNDVYLPGCRLPRNLRPQADLATAIAACRILVIAIPSAALRRVCEKAGEEIGVRHQGVVLATKGIEPLSAKLAHQVFAEAMRCNLPHACLSGPSFADEVARGAPTAVIAASKDSGFANKAAELFRHRTFRVYTSDDVVGTEIAGTFKNIIAIAVGISDGLGFGSNARAALITRGLSEVRRLAVVMGGKSDTLNGLAGIGDLVLTCTSDQSRNRRFGLLIAEGHSTAIIGKKITQVAEGVSSATVAQQLARRYRVDLPICEQVSDILAGRINPAQAVKKLLERPPKPED